MGGYFQICTPVILIYLFRNGQLPQHWDGMSNRNCHRSKWEKVEAVENLIWKDCLQSSIVSVKKNKLNQPAGLSPRQDRGQTLPWLSASQVYNSCILRLGVIRESTLNFVMSLSTNSVSEESFAFYCISLESFMIWWYGDMADLIYDTTIYHLLCWIV